MADNRRYLKMPSTVVLEYHILERPFEAQIPEVFTWVPLSDEMHHLEHEYNVPIPGDYIKVSGLHYRPIGIVEPQGQTWVNGTNSFASLLNGTEPYAFYQNPTAGSPAYLREGTKGKYHYYQLVNATDYLVLDSKYPTDLKPGELAVGRRKGHETIFITSTDTNNPIVEYKRYVGGVGVDVIDNEINVQVANSTQIGGVKGEAYDPQAHGAYNQVVIDTNGLMYASGQTYDTISASNTSTTNGYLVAGAGTNTDMYLQGDGSWSKPIGTTYDVFTTTNKGLVPTGTTNTQKFLRGDGSWATPSNTTYAVFTTGDNGLTPASGTNTDKYLKGDGTWDTPTNNTYTATGVLSMSGNAVIHNNSTLAGGTYGPNTNVIIGVGETGSITIPEVTTDTYGHITGYTARTLTVTVPSIPEQKIAQYTAANYDTEHVSSTWVNIINSNQIEVGMQYDQAIQNLDTKVAGLADEVIRDEAVLAQGIEDVRDAEKYYTECSTANTNSAKEVEIDYNWSNLEEGERIIVGFTNGNTAENPTLKVNNFDAYPIWYNGAAVATNVIQANSKLLLLYKGGNFHIIGGAGEVYDILSSTYNNTNTGYVVRGAGSNANTNYFLDGTGNWAVPVDTTYGTFTSNAGLVPGTTATAGYLDVSGNFTIPTNTTYGVFTTNNGLVPGAAASNSNHYLQGNGTWSKPTDTTYAELSATSVVTNNYVVKGAGSNANTNYFLDGTGNWSVPVDTTYGTFTSNAGLVPGTTATAGYLNVSGEFTMPENTTYGTFTTSQEGLVPTGTTNTNLFLRGDGDWVKPTDTTYGTFTTGNIGLMPEADGNTNHFMDGSGNWSTPVDTTYGTFTSNAGLVPGTTATSGFLRFDGQFVDPENTTYGTFTTSDAGLTPAGTTNTNLYLNGEGGWTKPIDTTYETLSISNSNGSFLVPGAGSNANTNYFLDGTGNWAVPVDTTYGTFTTANAGLMPEADGNTNHFMDGSGNWSTPVDTTYGTFTSNAGLVPGTTATSGFLRFDGQFVDTDNTTYGTFTTGEAGLTPAGTTNTNMYLNGQGGWTKPVDTTYGTFTTSNAGLAPAGGTNTNLFLDQTGNWAKPTDTTYNTFTTSASGLTPAGTTNTNLFLRGDGEWVKPTDTTYGTFTTSASGLMPAGGTNTNLFMSQDGNWLKPVDTTYGTFTNTNNGLVPGSNNTNNTSSAFYLGSDGKWSIPTNTTYNTFGSNAGLVPQASTDTSLFLQASGSWAKPTDTTYDKLSATNTATSNGYLVAGAGTNTGMYLQGDGNWTKPTDTTYAVFTTSKSGLVPTGTTNTNRFLRGDGTWANPQDSDTTYGRFNTTTDGLVPASGTNTDKYLKGDGSWGTPTNNTYTATGVLSMNGNAVVHNNSTLAGGTYGPNTNVIIGVGETGSITIPEVTTDTYGHITGYTARTLTVTVPDIPEFKIAQYTAANYDTEHVSSTWANVINSNQIEVGMQYDQAIQNLDNKVSGLSNEVILDEAVLSQAIEDVREAEKYYTVCTNASVDAAKTARLDDYNWTNLEEGERIIVGFTNGNTAENPTLNINSLGTHSILYNGAAVATNVIKANSKLLLLYKDGNFHIIGGAGDSYNILSTTYNNTNTGYVVKGAGSNATTNYFLDGTGNWSVPVDTTYGTFTSSAQGLVPTGTTNTNQFLRGDGTWANPQDSDTTYGTFTTNYDGLVPMSGTNTGMYLQGNGSWSKPTDTTYGTFTSNAGLVPGTTATSGYLDVSGNFTIPENTTYGTFTTSGAGLTPAGTTNTNMYLNGMGQWTKPIDTTYGTFTTSDSGLVPSGNTNTNQYLNANGGWSTPTNTTYNTFTTTSAGLTPTGTTNTNMFLRGDGQWVKPTDTTYSTFTTSTSGLMPAGGTNTNLFISQDGSWSKPVDTTYGTFTTGAQGLVPTGTTNTNQFLRGDGTWANPQDSDTTYGTFTTNYNGLVPMSGTNTGMYLQGDGSWSKPTDTTYNKLSAANNVTTNGYLVPGAGTANNVNYILAGNGSWIAKPTDTTYRVFTTNTNGLVPGPASANTNNYLRADGSWATPTNNTYTATGILSMNGNAVIHNNSTLSAGTYGPNTNVIIGSGETGSIIIPEVTTDTYGHLTGVVARTLTITVPSAPDYKIAQYTNVNYDTTHVSTTWANVINSNAISEGMLYDTAINRLDYKISGLSDEVIWNEAVMAQAYVDAREADRYWGECTSASTNAAKTVTISDYTESNYTNGERFVISFESDSTATNPTLAINSLTAYPIYNGSTNVGTDTIKAGMKLLLVYYSTKFYIIGGTGSGSVFSGATSTNDGTQGIVPQPLSGTNYDYNKYLRGNGNWDYLKTMEDITIAGWNGQVGSGEYENGDVIPAGSTLQEILEKLFCKIMYPTITANYTWTVNGNTPSLSNSASLSNNTHVPVGTQFTITESFNTPTVTRRGTLSTFTYGYAETAGGTVNTSTSFTTNYASTASGNYTLQMSFTGFNSASTTSSTGSTLTTPTLTVTNGNNVCTAASTSQTYSAGTTDTKTLYIANSAYDTDADHTTSLSNSAALAQVSTWNTAKTGTKSTTFTVVGYWPSYWGYKPDGAQTTNMTSDLVVSLNNTPESVPATVTLPGGTIEFIIAVPNRSYTTLLVKNAASQSPFATSSNYQDITVNAPNSGGTNTNYRVFYMIADIGTSDQNDYSVTLS